MSRKLTFVCKDAILHLIVFCDKCLCQETSVRLILLGGLFFSEGKWRNIDLGNRRSEGSGMRGRRGNW